MRRSAAAVDSVPSGRVSWPGTLARAWRIHDGFFDAIYMRAIRARRLGARYSIELPLSFTRFAALSFSRDA